MCGWWWKCGHRELEDVEGASPLPPNPQSLDAIDAACKGTSIWKGRYSVFLMKRTTDNPFENGSGDDNRRLRSRR